MGAHINEQQSHDDSSNQTPASPGPADDDSFPPDIDDPLSPAEEDVFDDILNDDIGDFIDAEEDGEDVLGRAFSRARHGSEEVDDSTKESKGDDGSVNPTEDPDDDNDTIKPDELSEQLGKELYELSMQERQRVYHHLHCLPDGKDDSPERESKALSDLNDWILKHYDTEEAAAYRMAESKNKFIVESRRLRLQFLRGVKDYDVDKAGKRLMSHFSVRLEYFGESKLHQERITMDDLDEDDIECLRHGFWQFLPLRDSGERGVLVLNCNALQYNTLPNALRAMYYTTMAFFEDDDFQKRGIAMILLGLQFGNNPRYLGFQFVKQLARLGWSTPTMCLGFHHCLQPGRSASLSSFFNACMPSGPRLHTRVHVGSHEENMLKLMSHGIPTQYMPVKDDKGTADTQWVLQWIEIRKQIDAQYKQEQLEKQQEENRRIKGDDNDDLSCAKKAITVPSPKDILMGRGRRSMTAPGNVRLYMVLDDHYERYENCVRYLKYEIAEEMVALVKSQGCRFLVPKDGLWYEADDVKARDKVSHDFRSLRALKKGDEAAAAAAATKAAKRNTTKKTKRSREVQKEPST